MPEEGCDSDMYNKEYYWSDAYHFFRNPYYGNSEWVSFDEFRHDISFSEKILLPVRVYYSERKGDTIASKDNAPLSWYKISGDIFTFLNLEYGKDDRSCLYDVEGNLVCFDSAELFGENLGYFIDQEQLGKYLNENEFTLIWTSLSEKRIICSDHRASGIPPKAIHYSAVYRFNKGNIEQVFGKQFVDKLYIR